MNFKKHKGKIFGVEFNKAEQKALDMEFRKTLAEYDRKNEDELDAIILWVLHTVFGFGPIRLKRFYDGFRPEMQALMDRYEMEECDQVWLCSYMLNNYLASYGTSLEEWRKESEESNA